MPVLYAAGDFDGALSETVFHDVAGPGPGQPVEKFALEAMVVSHARLRARPEAGAALMAMVLRRLGVTRRS